MDLPGKLGMGMLMSGDVTADLGGGLLRVA